jgi:membrane protein required for colicin V production
MNIVDIVILSMLGAFVLAGFWFGVIHMVGAIVGFFFGVWSAGHYYVSAGNWLAPYLGGNANLAKLIAFVFIFLIITRLFGLLMGIVNKIFKIIAIIPFLKTFNHLLGAAVGLLEGTLVLGLVIYFAAKYPINATFEMALRNSQLSHVFNSVGGLMSPLLPQAIKVMQSVL